MASFFAEGWRYFAGSAVALAADLVVLAMLVHFFGWWYLAAATTSFLLGTVVAYVFSIKYAFKYRRLKGSQLEFTSFAAIGVVGLGINAVVIYTAVKLWGLYYLVAKLIAVGFTFACNFVLRRQLLFMPGAFDTNAKET